VQLTDDLLGRTESSVEVRQRSWKERTEMALRLMIYLRQEASSDSDYELRRDSEAAICKE
jgi:hypothetical protein